MYFCKGQLISNLNFDLHYPFEQNAISAASLVAGPLVTHNQYSWTFGNLFVFNSVCCATVLGSLAWFKTSSDHRSLLGEFRTITYYQPNQPYRIVMRIKMGYKWTKSIEFGQIVFSLDLFISEKNWMPELYFTFSNRTSSS